MIIKKKNIYLLLILFFISIILIVAYLIQHVLGHEPCRLCIYERIPYIISIFLIPLVLFKQKYEKVILFILFIIFILSTLLSFYHFGIEQGFFKESLVCDIKNSDKSLSTEELLKELEEKTISCKDVTFKILGLSLATINTIISLILSVINIKLFLNYEKNK